MLAILQNIPLVRHGYLISFRMVASKYCDRVPLRTSVFFRNYPPRILYKSRRLMNDLTHFLLSFNYALYYQNARNSCHSHSFLCDSASFA